MILSKKEMLSAEISVEDKASKQLDRICDSIEKQTKELLKLQRAGDTSGKEMDKLTKGMLKQNNEVLRLKASLDKARNSTNKKMKVDVDTKESVRMVDRLTRGFHNLRNTANKTKTTLKGIGSGLSKLNPGLLMGTIGVAGAGYAGKKVFDSTFGSAANYEMSEKTIQAMFNDKKKSQKYMEVMQKMAIDSPLLNSQDIFSNSKSFIALTKSQNQLNQMWDLSERLLAVDPAQGIEGAVFGLRELFSGDSRSLAERFELSKKTLNDIKNLPLKEQLRELDKYFKKMGMTKKLVNEMGGTTLGVWNQIKETSEVALRKIGKPAVDIIRPYLKEINGALQGGKLNRFVKFGQGMAKGIAHGFVNITKSVGGWIDGIINDPAFQKLDTIPEKFDFVLDKVKTTFIGWYEKDGKAMIDNGVTTLVDSLISALNSSVDTILPIATRVGVTIGQGIVKGIASQVTGQIELYSSNDTSYGRKKNDSLLLNPNDFLPKSNNKSSKNSSSKGGGTKASYSTHAYGLKRVPRNNYPALLHEGERVQTKQQAKQTDNKTGSFTIAKLADQVVFREEADMDKFLDKLVKKLQKEKLNYGGAI